MEAAFPDLLRYRDLKVLGLTRHGLSRLVDAGEYERMAPGFFLQTGVTDDTTAGWMAINVKRPDATICLMSALVLHELTDDIPTRSDVAGSGSEASAIFNTVT